MTENAKSCALIFSTINKITWLIKKSKVRIRHGKTNHILNIMLQIKELMNHFFLQKSAYYNQSISLIMAYFQFQLTKRLLAVNEIDVTVLKTLKTYI